MDTALAILIVGIVASHLRMHCRERDDDDDDCYDNKDDNNNEDNKGGGLPWMVLADAAVAAADLVLAMRAWAAVAAVRDEDDNDCNADGKGGDSRIPNDAVAGGGGGGDKGNNTLSVGNNAIGVCLSVLNEETTQPCFAY